MLVELDEREASGPLTGNTGQRARLSATGFLAIGQQNDGRGLGAEVQRLGGLAHAFGHTFGHGGDGVTDIDLADHDVKRRLDGNS